MDEPGSPIPLLRVIPHSLRALVALCEALSFKGESLRPAESSPIRHEKPLVSPLLAITMAGRHFAVLWNYRNPAP